MTALAVVQLVVFLAFAGVKVNRARRSSRLIVARSLLNYVIGSALMACFLVVADHFFDYALGTLPALGELVLVGAASTGIYLAYVLATEHSVRRLVRAVLRQPVTG